MVVLLKSRLPRLHAVVTNQVIRLNLSVSDTDSMTKNQQPISEFKSKSGAKRIFGAFIYSIEGFKTAWKNEHSFRQELVLVVVATTIALLLPVSAFEKLMLIGVLILVLIVELINSAIEAVVDRVSLEHNPLSKDAKDLGSAAVFLTLSLAAATWAVILVPKYIH